MSATFELTDEHRQDLAATGAQLREVSLPGQGISLKVLDYGGDGVPVVILPGITTPAVAFDFVSRRLVGDYRPVVLDIRGRGLSDRGDSWSLDDYAADTEELIDVLGLEDVVLFGHSMGARIAANAAARARRPYRGVVVVDPPLTGPGRDPYPTTLEAFEGQILEAQAGTTPEVVSAWWPRWPMAECGIRARWLASCDLDAIRATYADFSATDFMPIWAQVRQPAVFMYGGESLVVTVDGAAECRAANPDAIYMAVPQAGHMVFWDNVDPAFTALQTALAEVTGR